MGATGGGGCCSPAWSRRLLHAAMAGRSFSASSPGAAMAGGAAARPWWVELARSYGGPKLPRLELRWRHQEWASSSSSWSPMTT